MERTGSNKRVGQRHFITFPGVCHRKREKSTQEEKGFRHAGPSSLSPRRCVSAATCADETARGDRLRSEAQEMVLVMNPPLLRTHTPFNMSDPMDIDRSLCKLFISNEQTRFFQSGSSGGGSTASKSTLNKLFDKYREDVANEPDEINIEGTMKLLEDIDVSPDDVGALILSEMVKSPSLGKLTRTEFLDSLAVLG
jgi:hypothetical protein